MRKILLSASLSLFTLTALAANSPTRFVMLNALGKTQLYSSSDQAAVQSNLQKVASSLSGGRLQLPVELPVIVPRTFGNAFYDPMSVMLVSPFQININGATKHPNFSRVIEMHEFGHAIFDENMETVFKFDPMKIRILREFNKLRLAGRQYLRPSAQAGMEIKMLLPVIEARKLPDSHPLSQDALAAIDIYKTTTAKFMELANRNPQIMKDAEQVLTSYVAVNEFFADVVAVAYTQDPHSLLRAISHAGVKINFSDRSFDSRPSQRALDTKVHNFYSLSRDYIYKYYLSDPVVRSKGKSWIVMKTLESISCALKNEKKLNEDLKAEFRRASPRVTWARFEMEGKNDALNDCVQATFEGR